MPTTKRMVKTKTIKKETATKKKIKNTKPKKIVKKTKQTKTAKAVSRRSPVRKTTIRRPISKSIAPKSLIQSVEPSMAVKIIALMLILLGYAAYRFYPIATVNGQVVSRLRYYQVMETQLGQTTLNNLITETLITDAAKKANLVIKQEDIDIKIASVEAQIKSQGMELTDALAQEGLTKKDLEREIMLQQIVETLGKGEVQITETQIDDFLAKNQSTAPKGTTTAELRELAKTQLETQAQRTNITSWLTTLKEKATIIYR